MRLCRLGLLVRKSEEIACADADDEYIRVFGKKKYDKEFHDEFNKEQLEALKATDDNKPVIKEPENDPNDKSDKLE